VRAEAEAYPGAGRDLLALPQSQRGNHLVTTWLPGW
jgi:hypothetical protein